MNTKQAVHQPLIGIDLGGTNIRAGRILNGSLLDLFEAPVSAKAPKEHVLEEVMSAIRRVFTPDCQGIGVAVPSVVDPVKGIVYNVENIPSWKEVHLKTILEDAFTIPVTVNNDANAFALGEYYFGRGKGHHDLVGLTIGTALGAGIVLQDRLYSGRNCGAGELGCIPYKDRTLEYYCSGNGIQAKWGRSGKDLYQAATQKDPEALNQFYQFGLIVGDAVSIAVLAYDPEAIIIGGSVSRSFSFFEAGMRDRLKSFPYQKSLSTLVIEPTQDTRIPVLGAAALHLDNTQGQ